MITATADDFVLWNESHVDDDMRASSREAILDTMETILGPVRHELKFL